MVLETALIHVQADRVEEFLAALPRGIELLKRAKGFVDIEVRTGVELEHAVLLLLRWETLEDHTVGFREGPLFPQWRDVIGPFFAEPPTVTHWRATDLA